MLKTKTFETTDASGCAFTCVMYYSTEKHYDRNGKYVRNQQMYCGNGLKADTLDELKKNIANL
jgi:hypothetical protein